MEPDEEALDGAREALAAVDAASYYRTISSLARTDAGSVLQPLPYHAGLEYHAPGCVVVEPATSEVETPHLYARAAYPEFDEVLLSAFTDPRQDALLTELYHRLFVDGTNVALVTNHGELVDIALVLAALVIAMCDPDRTFGVLGEGVGIAEMAQRANVLVSRMVTTRQAFGIPAIQVIQSMSRSWLSVPQTVSRRRVRIDPDLVRANNLLMREGLRRLLADGGQLVAMAASGSQDLSLAANLVQRVRTTWRQRRGVEPEAGRPSLHLQPLYDGTINLMLTCGYVLPVAIALDPAHPACVVGSMTRVRTPDDCHAVMDWVAAAHEERTGVTTIYHHHEDPLLVQVRDILRS
jgi:hypothetical protein